MLNNAKRDLRHTKREGGGLFTPLKLYLSLCLPTSQLLIREHFGFLRDCVEAAVREA